MNMHKFLSRALTAALVVVGLTTQVQAQTTQQTASVATRTADTYSAAVATEWTSLALSLTQQTPGFSPPVAARAFGYLGLALYESIVPGMPGYTSLAGQLNELNSLPVAQPDEPLHWPTVANASMAMMTRMMFSNATAENKGRIDQLERSLPLKYGQDFDPNSYTPEIINRSDSFGKLMAMAIMTWARTDGGHEAWGPLRRNRANYVPPSGAGRWTATPPAFAKPLLPYWGENRPFVLKSVKDCPAPPPPEYSEEPSSVFYKNAQEVYNISNAATQEQRQFALYWADDPAKTPTPAGHWLFIANDLLKTRKANLAEAAQTLARLNIAMSDAFTAGWATKYALNVLRPVTYVQGSFNSNWVPSLMITPPFPEYPSGHSVQSSAAAGVLSLIFGENTAFTDNTHNDRGWGPRTFTSFNAAANEAALSRLYAGIHFRFGVEGGQVQGKCVAAKTLALKFKTN
jgi:membrane-associated phospholipid phosphatase